MAADISSIVRTVLANEQIVYKALKHAKGETHDESDKASMRSVRTHPAYDLTFTLLNPQPEIVRARWDMQGAELAYLKPLQAKFSDYIDLHVTSQYVYKMGMGVRPKKDQAGRSTLQENVLGHIINPVEAYLASHVSNNPNLNFVVYVPTRDESPLHVIHANGEDSKTNTFLSPRWGSFMIYNAVVPENMTLPYRHDLDMRHVFQVLLPHIKLLLGVQPQVSLHGLQYLPSGVDIVNDWEVMTWLRSACVENIISSANTLISLADLLQKINNIVINDDIGSEVEKAVSSIGLAHKQLRDGELRQAFISSKQARISSEKAFFDPSLLELLYFPEDQKFAIYIPLFLPIGIPVVMSLLNAVKYFTKKTDTTKTDTTKTDTTKTDTTKTKTE